MPGSPYPVLRGEGPSCTWRKLFSAHAATTRARERKSPRTSRQGTASRLSGTIAICFLLMRLLTSPGPVWYVRQPRCRRAYFCPAASGSRITSTFVSRAGIFAVLATKTRSALSLELAIGRSSIALGKFETQIRSPSLAR